MKRLFIVALGILGCADGAPAPPALVSLAAPVVIVSDNIEPASTVRLSAAGGLQGTPVTVEIGVEDVQVQLRSGDRPQLEALEIPLKDVEISAAALPPKGLKLRDLRLGLGQAVRAEVVHQQPDALELRAMAPLQLDWAIELADGSAYPLGRVETTPLAVEIDAVRAGERAHLTVTARCSGVCWDIPGIASLRDGELYLQAGARVVPQP